MRLLNSRIKNDVSGSGFAEFLVRSDTGPRILALNPQ